MWDTFIKPRGLVFLALGASLVSPVRAQDHASAAQRLVTTLISADTRLTAGNDAWLGLRFQIEKGWHIYWQNPGDSGEPPRVEWKLPPGITVAALEWPYPQRLEHSGIADFGYENDVVLPAKIHIAASATAGPARIDATVKWLVCSDICIPGKSNLYIVRTVAAGDAVPDAEAAKMISAARARVPRPMPASWSDSAQLSKDAFGLYFQTGREIANAQFFPAEPEIIENAAPQRITPLKDGFKMQVARSHELLKPVTRLNGVVVLGNGKAYLVSIPVRTQ